MSLTLKQFMDANCKEYVLQQIIATNLSLEPIKMRTLKNIEITAEESEEDPIYKILPSKVLGGFYGIFNGTLPEGQVILDFTKNFNPFYFISNKFKNSIFLPFF